ncbi:MAG: methyltransferase domain-containing protein [Planctomycetota bacterium]|jgi:ubiquinone/menaquinone biosynthesis C-methylase UbiE|nr:methyltransferase domain-containing protein [Planctomycetota bacterium]MDP6502336.1 methyltransferase domain-containing protein [Planctomycetota bacterium]
MERPTTESLAEPRFKESVEEEVRRRYARGAEAIQPALCCPTSYESEALKLLPEEILNVDYGCGDPSKYCQEGETVLDLGSGSGKICYLASHKVGANGSVIGVDFNDKMLALSRKYQGEMAEKLGWHNTRFGKGKIQDLALDLDLVQAWLSENPVKTVEDVAAYEAECERIRTEHPLVAGSSVDLVVSNCVLNLVRPEDKLELFDEIYRVLKRGGRAIISDIVCDEDPTENILSDPELWSGCISGAFREDQFLEMFEKAGFYGIEILERQETPWHVIEGIEFRSMTLQAFKGKDGPCMELNQAVVYKGPFKSIKDDDNHTYPRGRRVAVCEKTFNILTHPEGPYRDHFIAIRPHEEIGLEVAAPFLCNGTTLRHPKVTKGQEYNETRLASGECCEPDECC